MPETYNNISNNMIVIDGDFNFFFNTHLEAIGGNPKLKKNSVTKFIELKEKYYLCDIWRIRNLKTKRYTFRQHHASGLLQRRLDYFFISNSFQNIVRRTDVLASFLSDQSPILFSICEEEKVSGSLIAILFKIKTIPIK